MIVVYGLASADASLARPLHDGVAALGTVPCGPLVAVVAEHDQPPSRTTASVARHAEVVAEVTEAVPAAPVRFGIWYHEEAGLRQALEDREDELLPIVRHVAGAVEVVVRAADGDGGAASDDDPAVEPAPVGAGPGTAYLTARLAESRRRRERQQDHRQRLLDATALLEPRAKAHRLVDGRRGLERCFLVDRAEATRVVALASTIAEQHGLVVGGPWPPFTFADPEAP